MGENKKLTYDEYIDKSLNEYEEYLRNNPNPKTYTMEEFFEEWDAMIDNWEKYREQKRCAS